MKKLLFTLAFAAVALTSCFTDDSEVNYTGKDAVNVTIGINVPELEATRSGETGMDSGLGAIDNFSDDEWARYDVRYILEIYDVTKGHENLNTPVKKRDVNVHDRYEPTKFELRLVPDRTYKFVVWADFVDNGNAAITDPEQKRAIADLNYNTSDLKNITRIAHPGEVSAMHECMDAYFIQEDILITGSGLPHTLELTRPFGKLRVVTTDIDEVNIGTTPAKVDVTFYNHPIFTSLNALLGTTETTVDTVTYSFPIAKDAPYTVGFDSQAQNQTLFADYIFAQPQINGAQEVNFKMTITDQNNRPVRTHDFNTQIPLKRNHLTTIIGSLLTTTTEFKILIDDNFANGSTWNPDEDDFDLEVFNGKLEELPAVGADGVQDINTAGQFATYLLSDYKGKNARLNTDVDFGGYEIKHTINSSAGGSYVFDGQGHTVSNFTVSDGVNAGLFSILSNATIKNLTIKNALIAPNAVTRAYTGGDFYAGALAGTTQGSCTFENIHVIGCEVEGVNKVGGLIGNAAENYPLNVVNCSVENSKVYTTHTEDGGCVGGFIGYIVPNATIEKCSLKNTTINAINSANAAKRANAEFIGTLNGNGKNLTIKECTLEGNTFTQAETTYVTPESFGAWLGGIRYEGSSDVTVDGKSIVFLEPVQLATPKVTATPDFNTIAIEWEAVDNAASYSVTVGTDMPVFTEECSYLFTGEYVTEYTITVVAVPDDEERYAASEPATITTSTEREPVELAVAGFHPEVIDYKNIKLTLQKGDEVEGAIAYKVNDEVVPRDESGDYVYFLEGDYDTIYSFVVTAVADPNDKFSLDSTVYLTVTTKSDPYIYLKPNSNWTQANARFAVYTWNDSTNKWVDMKDSDSDGIYEVLKSDVYTNIIFCRMNPATTDNIWDNKWNQTSDLKVPTDGNNLFTLPNGSWDGASTSWSKK
ncbi:MAG: hypothetical protein IKJ38_05735 [Alistipes sp.]|nr:hypothetical protein [Alistipes sp.]